MCSYLNDGFIKDTEQNQKIIEILTLLEEKLFNEGNNISKKIIETKQKIPILLIPDVEELIDNDLEEDNLKLDNQTIEEKIIEDFE